MKISRAIAVQSLAVCAGLILVAAVTVYSWSRYDRAQSDAGANAYSLQEFRLLDQAARVWLLDNDLVFGSDQTALIPNARRQGELVIEKAESLRETTLGREAEVALADTVRLVTANSDELSGLQSVTPVATAIDTPDPLAAWDERARRMEANLELAGEQIHAAAEAHAAWLAGEKNFLITVCAITYLLFGLLVVALWRWLSRSLAKPLSDLTELVESALTSQKPVDLETAGPVEVEKLTQSINALIQGREAQAFERASELEDQKKMLESEVSKRISAEEAAQDAAQQARAASKAKSQFLASMSHEIRTPLNGIIGSAELLMHDSSPAKTSWGIDNIQKSSQHLLALVNDVLDFSKIEAGELELDPHAFLLDDLLMELRSIFAARAREKDLLFVYEIAPDVPSRIEADSLRMRQVLTNLISNAFTYTERGYVVLRCIWSDDRSEDGAALIWEVQDSGIGIPPEKQEHIFESFRQADSGTTRAFGGTGLGLAISKQLTEMMGGCLEVESEVGAGSVFRCQMQVSVPVEQPDPGVLPAGHALIAMENLNAQRIVGCMLEDFGWSYECTPMGEADELLSRTLTTHPDAVIMMDYRDLADTESLLVRCRDVGLHRIIFGNIVDIDHTLADPGAEEVILSYTLVPMELFSTLQSMLDPRGDEQAEDTKPVKLSGHVLLAEDNPVNQQVARAMLESLGLEVSIAEDGEIAVERRKSEAPDLILMDWHMPNLDGVAATRRIRRFEQIQGLEETPIVMFTADTQKDNRDICMEAGVNDFLSKPVQIDALRDTLTSQLSNRTERQPSKSRVSEGTA